MLEIGYEDIREGDLRLFWKIIVDTHKGEIRIEKEISIWYIRWPTEEESRRGKKAWKIRTFWKRVPLRYDIQYIDGGSTRTVHCPNEFLHVQSDCIRFNGGYLRVYDQGIIQDVRDWDINLENEALATLPVWMRQKVQAFVNSFAPENQRALDGHPQFGFVEQARLVYAGENIRLEASCILNVSDAKGITQPIFYYKQADDVLKSDENGVLANIDLGRVLLSETIVNRPTNMRSVHWEISRTSFDTDGFYLDGSHLLVVSQDRDANSDGTAPRFEMLVDAIPLIVDPPNDPTGRHLFTLDRRVFYIGYNPQEGEVMKGAIHQIVFDPNSSCNGCPGP